MIAKLRKLSRYLGFNFGQTSETLRGLPLYIRNYKLLKQQEKSARHLFSRIKINPVFGDRFDRGGVAKGHYFHQDLWVAQRVYENNPDIHIDVGSRVDGFVAHIAAFRKVIYVDIRSIDHQIPNIESKQANLMSELDSELVNSCDSLSCLHVLEHFGLGRYGDPVQYDGYITGLQNLHKMLRRNGKAYISVPIGPQRIEFDAHRVFPLAQILSLLQEKFRINDFSYVDDQGDMHRHADLTAENIESNFGCAYGCGIFELTKT